LRGHHDGVGLLLHIVAMLIVMVALVALANRRPACCLRSAAPLSLERVAGCLRCPWPRAMGTLGRGHDRRPADRHQDDPERVPRH
jgi:CNT family concentrative nucleoside transporter